MFYRFGRSRAGTRPPLLQVWISGNVFVRFYAVFCDFGSPLELLLAPFGLLFSVNWRTSSGLVKNGLPGPKMSRQQPHPGAFRVPIRRISGAV